MLMTRHLRKCAGAAGQGMEHGRLAAAQGPVVDLTDQPRSQDPGVLLRAEGLQELDGRVLHVRIHGRRPDGAAIPRCRAARPLIVQPHLTDQIIELPHVDVDEQAQQRIVRAWKGFALERHGDRRHEVIVHIVAEGLASQVRHLVPRNDDADSRIVQHRPAGDVLRILEKRTPGSIDSTASPSTVAIS